jgi:hypothetical protein
MDVFQKLKAQILMLTMVIILLAATLAPMAVMAAGLF